MQIILNVLGVLCILAGLVCAYYVPEGFTTISVVYILSGIVSGLIFFTMSMILKRLDILIEIQHNDSYKIELLTVQMKNTLPKKKCSNCGAEYASDYTSCPKCGTR